MQDILNDSERLRMIMLRILKYVEPQRYEAIFPTYSIELQAIVDNPPVFRRWLNSFKYTAQIFLDKYFNGDANRIEELRQMILKQQSMPYYMERARQVRMVLGSSMDSPEALDEYLKYQENGQTVYKDSLQDLLDSPFLVNCPDVHIIYEQLAKLTSTVREPLISLYAQQI